LIRRQLEFLDCLLKRGDNGDDWPDGLRLAQFGLPRRLAILDFALPLGRRVLTKL